MNAAEITDHKITLEILDEDFICCSEIKNQNCLHKKLKTKVTIVDDKIWIVKIFNDDHFDLKKYRTYLCAMLRTKATYKNQFDSHATAPIEMTPRIFS